MQGNVKCCVFWWHTCEGCIWWERRMAGTLSQVHKYVLLTWKTPWASALTARWRGVRPKWSLALASAPASNSRLAASVREYLAAKWRAVSSVTSTLLWIPAPSEIRSCTIWPPLLSLSLSSSQPSVNEPLHAAKWSAVNPPGPGWFISQLAAPL